jgi:KUP system potassium uptake protein
MPLTKHHRPKTPILAIGALGVVFGDIGTSPLYAFRACLAVLAPDVPTHADVLGILSIIVWSLMLVIGLKYVTLVLRADNGGEGGILALLALATGQQRVPESGESQPAANRGWLLWVALIGAALLYGDGMITPAISVLGALEGLSLEHLPQAHHSKWIVVAALVIVTIFFSIQRFGSGGIGKVAGPIMLLWFLAIGAAGLYRVLDTPEVLRAISPLWAIELIGSQPLLAFLLLGAVVLCVTGGEALYADMGHFGRRAIALSWWLVACPGLLLSYFGQGAIVLEMNGKVENPFFASVPSGLLLPMVVLATVAAVIASQAIISGVFSMTRQLSQRGLLPSMRVIHTSPVEGQIFLPGVNKMLFVATFLMVVMFQSSAALASAYGLAVTGVMLVTTMLFAIVARTRWHWGWWIMIPVIGLLLFIDLCFFSSSVLKIPNGGWLPLLVAGCVMLLCLTWFKGIRLVNQGRFEDGLPVDKLMEQLADGSIGRVDGTGVFLGRALGTTPATIRKIVRHLSVLPDTIVILHIQFLPVPRVPFQHRMRLESLDQGIWQIRARFGYMQAIDIQDLMRDMSSRGVPTEPETTTFWIRRDLVVPAASYKRMTRWRGALFGWMLRNASFMPDMLELPPRRTIEIGMRVNL